MTTWSSAPAITTFLGRVHRRLALVDAIHGAAAGLGVAIAVALHRTATSATASAVGLAFAAVGASAWWMRARSRSGQAATLVEHRAPECRNVLVTAAELLRAPERVRPYIGELVCREAARTAGGLDIAALFPVRRALSLLGVVALVWVAVLVEGAARTQGLGAHTVALESTDVGDVEIVVTPPAYAARPQQTYDNPARIDALEGSRIQLRVRANAASVTLETAEGSRSLDSQSNAFVGELLASADGYVALEPRASDGRAGPRRLIGLSVKPDQSPRVRITAPARDLFLAKPDRTLAITLSADDDIGLASLTLRYTKVSGAGEQFTFTDGDIPLTVVRAGARQWTGRASWSLAGVGLTPGDMVVYRGVATDARPGAAPSESDSYVVEIMGPGSVASEGFAVDDQFDRYALSEQMVILKTERLSARRSSIAADSLTSETLALAAEQRAVRAEFVFMMGGELADDASLAGLMELNEEDEAKAEDDLAAGHLANQGRAALLLAIRAMSRASTSLMTKDLDKALKDERSALTFLQGAFARTRYILRALTERERLDPSRRLTGELAMAARDTRPVSDATVDRRVAGLRRVLAGVAALAGEAELTTDAAARATTFAQSVLVIDPADTALQAVAVRLTDAATAATRGSSIDARALLDRAATALAAAVRAGLPSASSSSPGLNLSRLDGALTDALRSREERR